MRLSLPALVLIAIACRAQDAIAPPFPAAGRLIDLGGWRLHLNCTGQASPSRPTVILEAGAGDFSVDWSLVQPLVASFARVCSYDRAGAGWSDLGPRPRTMRQQVWELHALLEKAGEKPPFVLVGHSYGGWLVRLGAEAYPADVSGVVLIESGAEDPLRVIDGKVTHASKLAKGQPVPAVKTSDPLRESDIPPHIISLIQSSIRGTLGRLNNPPRDKLPAEARRMREWSLSQIKHAASNDNPFEADELVAMLAERKKKQNVLGDLPLIVVSRGLLDEEGTEAVQREEAHRKDQAALVTLSSRGKQVVAAKSGHHVPLDEPNVVVSAIREIVQTASRRRNQAPPAE
jgi:pimeloyl-ACP methyl ester carboxylesterase